MNKKNLTIGVLFSLILDQIEHESLHAVSSSQSLARLSEEKAFCHLILFVQRNMTQPLLLLKLPFLV